MTYELSAGDCVFIDCRKAYSHSTGYNADANNSCGNNTSVNNTSGNNISTSANSTPASEKDTAASQSSGNPNCVAPSTSLWSLQWCHFYAPFLPAIYEKYKERGGSPVFHPDSLTSFTTILTDLYTLASSSDYIRDMRINESLSALLTLLMEQSWHPESKTVSRKRLELVEIKNYLDEHYTEKIVLDGLSEKYYINKYYLTKIFKVEDWTKKEQLNWISVKIVKGCL